MSSFFHSHLTLLCNLPSIICFHDCQLELQTKALLHCSGHVCAQISSNSYTNANMCVLLHVHRAVKVTDSGHAQCKYTSDSDLKIKKTGVEAGRTLIRGRRWQETLIYGWLHRQGEKKLYCSTFAVFQAHNLIMSSDTCYISSICASLDECGLRPDLWFSSVMRTVRLRWKLKQ